MIKHGLFDLADLIPARKIAAHLFQVSTLSYTFKSRYEINIKHLSKLQNPEIIQRTQL